MGHSDIDTRADVFALGCVLFECLAGKPVFAGEEPVAVLAKVLHAPPPMISAVRPELEMFDDVFARLLAKDREQRAVDGSAVLTLLENVSRQTHNLAAAKTRPPPTLTSAERRIVSVNFRPTDGECEDQYGDTGARTSSMGRLAGVASKFGASASPLADGRTVVFVLRAAMWWSIRPCRPLTAPSDPSVPARVTCRLSNRMESTTSNRSQSVRVIDTAVRLLQSSVGEDTGNPGVIVDAVTSGLIASRFDVRDAGTAVHLLVSERTENDGPRLLLGKPTPCVGRDRELSLLHATLRECIEESVARAVLVTGPPGQGKSRLQSEFVAQARVRGDTTVVIARGDPIGAGSGFMIARQLVRNAAGLAERVSEAEQRARLRVHVAETCKARDVESLADALAELLESVSHDPSSRALQGGRRDPQTMASWLRESFADWIGDLSSRPVLLVVDDLHWGDLPSVNYLGDALSRLLDRPLMVLALARPEIEHIFRDCGQAPKSSMCRSANSRPGPASGSCRPSCGDKLTQDATRRIVERADGNAFFLEELIRCSLDDEDRRLPKPCWRSFSHALERLEPRPAESFVRRAYSVKCSGRAGWPVDPGASDFDLAARLRVARGRRNTRERARQPIRWRGRIRVQTQPAARSGVRDAYGGDRATGHRVAGEWLEQAGEKDALTLADHFELGGDPQRAVPWILQAQRAAIDSGNLEATIRLGLRGVTSGAEGVARGSLVMLRAAALFERGDLDERSECGLEAIDLLSVGSERRFYCAAHVFIAAAMRGDEAVMARLKREVLSAPLQLAYSGRYGSGTL